MKPALPDKKMTGEEFTAWCEWRKWCSIFRVKEPQPSDEEKAAGKTDDKTAGERERYYDYLSKRVANGMRHRITCWKEKYEGQNIAFALPSDPESALLEYLSEFDTWMNGQKKRKTADFSGNSYKDYIFYLIKKNPSDAAAIINGKIFNSKYGYLTEIVSVFLRHAASLEPGQREGRKNHPMGISLYTRGPKGETQSLLDTAQDDKSENRIFKDDVKRVPEIACSLSREEKLIIAAQAYRVSISNPVLLDVLHCRKEKAANLRNALFSRIKRDYPEFSQTSCLYELLKFVFSDLKSEKEAESFLLWLKESQGGTQQ